VATATTRSVTRCDLFGGMMKDAFANDDSLGKRENAGLKKGPNYNSEVTINGKAVKNAVAGQKVSQVAAAAGQKISYSCNKGDCATWYVDKLYCNCLTMTLLYNSSRSCCPRI
jgi:hypothetical protein